MRNHHVRTLSTVLLIIQLTNCALLLSPNKKCTDPHLELIDTEWYIYMNLPQIDIHSCKKIHRVQSRSYLRSEETAYYYDVTRNCLNMSNNPSIERTTTNNSLSNWKDYFPNFTKQELYKHKARVDLKKGLVILPSTTVCKFSSGFCYDSKDNDIGYVWDTRVKPQEAPSCGNLIHLQIPVKKIFKFALQREYLVFEGLAGNLAVELAKEVTLCNTKMWTNNAGLMVTNDTFNIPPRDDRNASEIVDLQDKQTLYQSLVEQCQSEGWFPDLYVCAIVFLMGYVTLQFLCSTYNLAVDCATFRRVEGGSCKWLFQSSINKLAANKYMVDATKMKAEIEMKKLSREAQPSYYEFRRLK